MDKFRINFTVRDYYDYIGTNPYYSIRERMERSIPDQFKKVGYNIKFKKVKSKLFPFFTHYRVHMSLRISEEDLKNILKEYENMYFCLSNISYKKIINRFN